MPSRRGFLGGLAALALPRPSWADAGRPDFLAAAKVGDGYVLHGLTRAGSTVFKLPLPSRGHAAAAHPVLPLAIAFARRPGTFAVVIDCSTGIETHRMTPPDGRQFNGHGAFSADGQFLYTSEVVAATAEGRIGLWRTKGFARVGEFASGGIGPHDLKRLADGSLIVANGGIKTDPNDRTKLNIPDMRPNLTHLSSDGVVLDRAELPATLHQNSIRHLALALDGHVAFAMQWEGDAAEDVPLLGHWTPGQPPRLFGSPTAEVARMKGYAGSIAMDADGTTAITSPKGGVVLIHDRNGMHLATHARADICGVSASDSGFIATDGGGALWACDTAGLTLLSEGGPAWDNHIVAVGA